MDTMKDKMKKLYNTGRMKLKALYARKRLFWGSVIVLVIVLFVIFGGKKEEDEFSTVTRAELMKTVIASGTVTSDVDLDLSFEKSGTVTKINVSVGDEVRKGDVLATLDQSPELAELRQAQGDLQSAKESFDILQAGLSSAENTLEATKSAQDSLVEATYRAMLSDDLEAIPTSKNTDQKPPTVTGLYAGDTEGTYTVRVDSEVNSFATKAIYKVFGLETDLDDDNDIIIGRYLPVGILGVSILFPSDFTISGYDTDWTISVPNKNGASYASNYTAYQTAIANRDLAVSQAQTTVDAKEAELAQSGITSYTADIVRAQGGVSGAYASLEDTIIRAPSDGKITKIDVKLGEPVESLSGVIGLQNVTDLYIEADVNESNIVGVSIGQSVAITFDALGDERVFAGTVSEIDYSPKDEGSVVNYRITVLIEGETSELRTGMTANIVITTLDVKDAIAVPKRSLIEKNDGTFVTIVNEKGKHEVVPVTLGREGNGGMVEVVDGINEGETIVLNPR